MKKFVVTKKEEGLRYVKFIKKIFTDMPDSLIYKLFRKKYFELNNKKANGKEILTDGDIISIFIGDDTYTKFAAKVEKFSTKIDSVKKQDIKRNIVYEDDNIILYDKEVGLLSQNDKNNDISVNSLLREYVKNIDKLYTPSIVNRLDRNTSGIIIFAKTYIAAREISKMIKEGRLEKHYVALVNGNVAKNRDSLTHLYKKDVKSNKAIIKPFTGKIISGYTVVKLDYKVIKRYKNATLLDINLITGKSHQIRSELSYIGHPIVCDKKYMDINLYKENVKDYNKTTQELCCYSITFSHFDNEMLKNIDNKKFTLERYEEI